MPLTLAALALALAAPASAACAPPQASDDTSALVHKMGDCFPGSDAAQVEVLNLTQLDFRSKEDFVRRFSEYIANHPKNPEKYEYAANGGRAENSRNAELSGRNLATASELAGAIYDAKNGIAPATSRTAAPTRSDRPAVVAPVDRATKSGPPPSSTAEDIVADVAKITQDPVLIREAAALAGQRHDYPLAYARFAAVPQDPHHPDFEAQLGAAEAAYQAGDFAAARAAADAALKARPGDKDALAVLHFSDGRVPTVDLRGAAAGFGPAAATDGGLRDQAGASRSAAATATAPAFRPPSGLDPRAAGEDQAAATALKLGDLDAAVAHAARSLAIEPRDEHAFLYRSAALGRQGRWAGAENDAARALALAPEDPEALLAHIKALMAQGRWEEALDDADRLTRVDGGRAYAHRIRARVLAGLRDRPGALGELARAAALDPSLRPLYERAVQLPQSEDLALLFPGDEAAPSAAAPPAAPPSRARSAAFVSAGAVALGALIAGAVLLARRRRRPAADAARLHGRFEVVRRIGAGGMGVVDEARDLALGRRVAIKRVRDENSGDGKERQLFLQEARAVARLKHPGIVEVYEVYEDGRDACVVFEFVDGRTLHQHVASKPGGLGFAAALELLRPACAAVQHAHAAGLVHRDLKPANMMLDAAGRLKIMDFGAARPLSASADDRMTSTIIGTPPYMAPEQEQGVVRRESDVYALAVTLYEVATGRFPFEGAGALLTQRKLEGKPRPAEGVADVPPGFDAAITAALAPDPEKRPRTPGELLASFEALARARA